LRVNFGEGPKPVWQQEITDLNLFQSFLAGCSVVDNPSRADEALDEASVLSNESGGRRIPGRAGRSSRSKGR
jgi:hypothetical protein